MQHSLEHLLLSGAIEFSGVDGDTGEILYSITEEAKNIMPELYKDHLEFVHQEIMYFWERGFLDIDDMAKSNPVISLTERCFDENAVATLSRRKQRSLIEIINALRVV
jgi:hypothetical protein